MFILEAWEYELLELPLSIGDNLNLTLHFQIGIQRKFQTQEVVLFIIWIELFNFAVDCLIQLTSKWIEDTEFIDD